MIAPLDGYLVLDLTQGKSGPFCGMQSGDAGADVIKLEPLEGDWARQLGPPFVAEDSTLFMGLNRNKRSISLNFEDPRAKDIIFKLIEKADVLIESFRPGAIDEMGLGYDTVSKINPRLVYCSISPFDQVGPYAQRDAGDLAVQGVTGLHRFHGEPDSDPVRIGFNYAGIVTDIYAFQAIVAAIFWRLSSGIGQKVETSMIRAMLATQNNYILSDSEPDPETANTGFNISHLAPPYVGTKTKDLPIFFSFGFSRQEKAWERFCQSVEISDEIINDDRFNTPEKRQKNEDLLKPYYEEAFKDRTSEEVLKLLDDVDAICAPHHTYETLFKDPNILDQEMLLEMDHPTAGKMNTFGLIWRLTKTPGSVRLAPPKLGQHTDEILSSLNYPPDDIKMFHSDAVVKSWR